MKVNGAVTGYEVEMSEPIKVDTDLNATPIPISPSISVPKGAKLVKFVKRLLIKY